MRHAAVDLNAHINQTSVVGNPADFPLAFTEAMYRNPVSGAIEAIPNRHIVARADTGRALSVVSDRYSLVPHTAIIESIDGALKGLDVGPTPRGIYIFSWRGENAGYLQISGSGTHSRCQCARPSR